MRLIDAELLTTNIAQIAKNCARSDAQKALIGRILFMIDNMPTDDKDEPTVKAVTEEQYNAAVVKLLSDLSNCGYEPPRELIRHNGDALIFPRYCPECGADTKREVK